MPEDTQQPPLLGLTLNIYNKGTYCDVTSPQLPGRSAVGQSDTAAIGNFIKHNAEKLGITIVVCG